MNSCREFLEKTGLPPPSQIGVVVRDVDRSARHYAALLGIGPFTIYEFAPQNHWYLEEPSPVKFKMGKAMWGLLELELLQPLEGRSLHAEFLASHGEGLQHLGIHVQDYDGVCHRMRKEGFQPLMRAETFVETYQGHLRACYFDTRAVGGVILEVIWRSWVEKGPTAAQEEGR